MKEEEKKLYFLTLWSEASQEKVKQRLVAITERINKVLHQNSSPNQPEDSHGCSEEENID